MALISPLCLVALFMIGAQRPAPTPGPLERMAEGARAIAGQLDRLPAGRVSISRRVWVERGGKMVTDARERHTSVFEGRKFHTWMEGWTGRREWSRGLYAERDLWTLFDGSDTYFYFENQRRDKLMPDRTLWKYEGQNIDHKQGNDSNLFHPFAEANYFLSMPWEEFLTQAVTLYRWGPPERLENGRMRMAWTYSNIGKGILEWDPAMGHAVTRLRSEFVSGAGSPEDHRIEYTRVGEFILPRSITMERSELGGPRWGEELVFHSYELGAGEGEDRFAVDTSELAAGTRVFVSSAGGGYWSSIIEQEERVFPPRIVGATLLAALLSIGWVLAIRRAGRASAQGLECAREVESSAGHG